MGGVDSKAIDLSVLSWGVPGFAQKVWSEK